MIINGFGLKGVSNYLSPILRNKLYIKASIMGLITGGDTSSPSDKKTSYWVSGYKHEEKEVSQTTIANFEEMAMLTNTALSEKKVDYFKKMVNDKAVIFHKKRLKIILMDFQIGFPPFQPDDFGVYNLTKKQLMKSQMQNIPDSEN